MSFSAQGGFSGGRGRGRPRRRLNAEINVTPLVDVMLVLLVIFIITAPALKEGIDVDLPKTQTAAGTAKRTLAPLTVIIDSAGKVHVGDKVLLPEQVAAELPALVQGREKETLTLKAHRTLTHESVVRVIAVLRRAGVKSISIAVDTSK